MPCKGIIPPTAMIRILEIMSRSLGQVYKYQVELTSKALVVKRIIQRDIYPLFPSKPEGIVRYQKQQYTKMTIKATKITPRHAYELYELVIRQWRSLSTSLDSPPRTCAACLHP